jgi:hypothetical protein
MINRIVGKRSLGVFILLFFVALPAVSYAFSEVNLQWGASSSGCEGYYVFGREEGQDYNYDEPWWQGDNTFNSCTIDELDEGKTYYFVIRAYAGDEMSADSNEVRLASYDDSENLSNGDAPSKASNPYHRSSWPCFISSLFSFE